MNIIADPPSVYDLEVEETAHMPPTQANPTNAKPKVSRQVTPGRMEHEDTSEVLVERVLKLEVENARLRAHLQLLAGAKATGSLAPAASASPPPLINLKPKPSESFANGSSLASFEEEEVPSETEAETEAETADLLSNWKVEIAPEPRDGCTVIHVEAPDHSQLLAEVSRILNGLGLIITNARINRHDDRAFDEYCVQHIANDGSGLMSPAQDVFAIEQRLRQWSEGRQSVRQLLHRPMRSTHRLVPLHIEARSALPQASCRSGRESPRPPSHPLGGTRTRSDPPRGCASLPLVFGVSEHA